MPMCFGTMLILLRSILRAESTKDIIADLTTTIAVMTILSSKSDTTAKLTTQMLHS